MTTVVLLNSGGFDTFVVADKLRKRISRTAPVLSLFVNYGQRAVDRERVAARFLHSWLNVGSPGDYFHEIEVSLPNSDTHVLLDGMTFSYYEKPSRGAKRSSDEIVPARNLLFLSYALMIGASVEKGSQIKIYAGFEDSRRSKSGDKSPPFVKSFEQTANLSLSGKSKPKVSVVTPIQGFTKKRLAKYAMDEADVPVQFSWSCQNDLEKQCGICFSCLSVKSAFAEISKDLCPIDYEALENVRKFVELPKSLPLSL